MCPERLTTWAAKMRARYGRLRAEKLCVRCEEPSGGKARCPGCNTISHAATKRWRARNKKTTPAPRPAPVLGACACGNPPMTGKALCWCCSQKAAA